MRISDFVKTVEKNTAAPPPAVKPLKTAVPPVRHPAADPSADVREVEKKIRKEIEGTFEKELLRIRDQMEKDFLAQAESEKKRISDAQQELQRERVLMQEQRDKETREMREALAAYRREMEQKLKAEFEGEKKRLEEKFREALSRSQDTAFRAANTERVQQEPVMPPLPDPEPPAVHEAPAVDMVNTVEPEADKERFALHVPVPSQTEETLPPVELDLDPKLEATAKAIRDELIEVTERIFDDVAKNQRLNLEKAKFLLGSIVTILSNRDLEFMRLSLDVYPEGSNHFVLHGVNVAIFSLILAHEFPMEREALIELGLAALLHDIGLVNVRDNLAYPKRLTPDLEKEILQHPVRGAEIVKPFVSRAAWLAVLQHHEIGNGKGYPSGLMEEDIHVFARVIHVVDSFEALIHERPYRKNPMDVNEAIKQLIDTGRGIYDREVLKALMIRIGLYPVMTYVELSNKQIAHVIKQNRQFPISPIVRVEVDEYGMQIENPVLMDLSQTQFVHIVGPVKKQQGEYPASRFASTETVADNQKKQESSEVVQNLISVFLILLVVVVLAVVIIKI